MASWLNTQHRNASHLHANHAPQQGCLGSAQSHAKWSRTHWHMLTQLNQNTMRRVCRAVAPFAHKWKLGGI